MVIRGLDLYSGTKDGNSQVLVRTRLSIIIIYISYLFGSSRGDYLFRGLYFPKILSIFEKINFWENLSILYFDMMHYYDKHGYSKR